MAFQPPKLLSDEPAGTDSFGAHKRIADALATLITSSEGGKSIRLDGAWGAGKSTVVEMLREQLTAHCVTPDGEPPGFSMFLYDAWVHSGDGLRRAFFEGLVKNTKNSGWIAAKSKRATSWRKKLLEMAGKRKLTKKRTKPDMGRRARFAITLSVTAALVSPAVFKILSMLVGDLPVEQLAGLTLVTTSLVFMALWRISPSDLRVLMTRAALEEVTDTTADPNPSSLEFQKVFNKLMTQVLTSERRLLIVIDNLDRIDFDEAKQIWTLLRSFLDNPAFRDKAWFRQLWLLVPIADESHLLGLEGGQMADTKQKASPGNMMEKIFQVRMSLPLPMLRSWKDFLVEKLSTTFGPDHPERYELIARILHAVSTDATPTPRELVVFINELIALHIERQGDMPLPTLAAYILSRGETRARDYQIPLNVQQVYSTPTLDQDFATLYLHADKSQDALYLLLMPDLERALEKGDPKELKDVLARSLAALDILDQWLSSSFSRMSQSAANPPAEQALFLAYLRALTLFIDESQHQPRFTALLNHIRQDIDRVVHLTPSLDMSNPNIAVGVDAYLKLSGNETFAIDRVMYLLRTIRGYEEPSEPGVMEGRWSIWSNSLLELLSIEKVRHAATLSGTSRIRLTLTNERWAALCELAEKTPEWRFVLDVLELEQKDAGLVDWLTQELIPMNSDSRAETVLRQGLHSRGKDFYRTVADGAMSVLHSRSDIPVGAILDCLTCLVAASNDEARPFIKTIADNGKLISWVRTSPSMPTFGMNEPFARVATLYLWAKNGLTKEKSSTELTVFESTVRRLLTDDIQGNTESLMAAVCKQISLTKAYDVVPIIADCTIENIKTLGVLLKLLCDDDGFRDAVHNELSREADVEPRRILTGSRVDVVRTLLEGIFAQAVLEAA